MAIRQTCFLCGVTLVSNNETDARKKMDAHGEFVHDLPRRPEPFSPADLLPSTEVGGEPRGGR